MNKQLKNYLQKSLVTLDLIVLNVVFLFTRFILENRVYGTEFRSYFGFWLALNAFWILISLVFRTYSDNNITNFEYFTKRTAQVFLLWIIATLFYLFFSRQFEVSRIFILLTIIFFGVGLFINRFLYLGLNNYFKNRNHLFNKVIIIEKVISRN